MDQIQQELNSQQLSRALQSYNLQKNHVDELYHTGQLHQPKSFFVQYRDEERSLLKQYDMLDQKTEDVLGEYLNVQDKGVYNKFINVSNSRHHCDYPKYVNNDTGLIRGRYSNNGHLPSREQRQMRKNGSSLNNKNISQLFSQTNVSNNNVGGMFDNETYAEGLKSKSFF